MATTASVPSTTTPVYQDQIVTSGAARKALAAGRIVIGWTFLWAFLDKLLGLGYMTPAERAWINGGTPAQGFTRRRTRPRRRRARP
ncbi:hypothetical protein [Georgenia sp. SUBG003]|uniref:hypothetical protein n=1 Tax=Georgenia sp. SUBG003 TaxID=1497974 RepID=UPI003AB3F7CD